MSVQSAQVGDTVAYFLHTYCLHTFLVHQHFLVLHLIYFELFMGEGKGKLTSIVMTRNKCRVGS